MFVDTQDGTRAFVFEDDQEMRFGAYLKRRGLAPNRGGRAVIAIDASGSTGYVERAQWRAIVSAVMGGLHLQGVKTAILCRYSSHVRFWQRVCIEGVDIDTDPVLEECLNIEATGGGGENCIYTSEGCKLNGNDLVIMVSDMFSGLGTGLMFKVPTVYFDITGFNAPPAISISENIYNWGKDN